MNTTKEWWESTSLKNRVSILGIDTILAEKAWDEISAGVKHLLVKPILEELRSTCKCDTLEKLLTTNFPIFRCPACEQGYFSSGNATVIDKCHLGNAEERKAKGLPY